MIHLVTDYLDNSAKEFPDKIAFSDERRAITFYQLQKEAKKVAQALIDHDIFKSPIVIFLEKSVEVISCFMGVAYSGNFYTPIDVTMPQSRILKIMDTLQPFVIITDEAHSIQAQKFAGKTQVVFYEDLQKGFFADDTITKTLSRVIDTDVLYVLFTSGSTGTPKGVIVSHKSVISYIDWVIKTFFISENTVFGNQAPFYFSMSVTDIFSTLSAAATMYIVPKQLFSFPIKLLEYISEHNINTVYWVPSVLCLIANFKALGKRNISCLKTILFAGEVMPAKQLNIWRSFCPDALFANLFGPTETTDICTYYIIKRNLLNTESVPIGEPCNNCGILILNDKNEMAGKNEQGELCIRGSFLAYGYYNLPQKTKEVFIQNPLNHCYPEIIYRTGDVVKYNDKNELIYLGRKDFQIKHMGHRIELGEIETSVSSLEGIKQCCCLYDEENQRIVLFYTGNLEGSEISDHLKALVPKYMIPNYYEELDEMPINLNGKIDRKMLKEKLENG